MFWKRITSHSQEQKHFINGFSSALHFMYSNIPCCPSLVSSSEAQLKSICPLRFRQILIELRNRVIGSDAVAFLIIVALVHKCQVVIEVKRRDVLVEIGGLIIRQVKLGVIEPIRK